MLSELNNYNPVLLTEDTSWEITAIDVNGYPNKALANNFDHIDIVGVGFVPSGTSTEVSSPQVLWIFNSDIIPHFVTVAEVVSDSSAICRTPKNKDMPTFEIFLSKNFGSKWSISSTLSSTSITVFSLPEIRKVAIENTVSAGAQLSHHLTFTGLRLTTLNEFSYNVKWNGFGSPTVLSVISESSAEATVHTTILSPKKLKCHLVPSGELAYPILANFWSFMLLQNSTYTVDVSLDMNMEGCANSIEEFETEGHYVPFTVKTTTQTQPTISSPSFTKNTQVTVPDENMLEYLFGSNWYCLLNKAQNVPFIQQLWALQNLEPYMKYEIQVEREIMHPNSVISASTESKRVDIYQMQFMKVTDANQVTNCSWTMIDKGLEWSVCLSSTADYGHSFLLSIIDSSAVRVDNQKMKMITLYLLPAITSLKLHARAHLVNGSYPQYPDFEFVEISVENPNSASMEILPVKWRTHILHHSMNVTWISNTSLVCKTATSLNIENFCIEISYDDGVTWSFNCLTQLSILQKEIVQILYKSQTFHLNEGQKSVQFSLVCFYHIPQSIIEICSVADSDEICTNPSFYEYSSQPHTTPLDPSAFCEILNQADFEFYENKHNIEWVLPSKVYKSGNRQNLRLFGSNFKEITQCRFEVVAGGISTTTPIVHDETFVECPLPDFSSESVVNMVDVFVGLPQQDGTLFDSSKVKIHLVNNPTVASISPLRGFLQQQRDIRIEGNFFYNFETLHVKAKFIGKVNDMLLDCLVVSNELLIIKAPNAVNIPMYQSRAMKLYVSSNGVDYSSETVTYLFLDEPHMTSLTNMESDYEGNIPTSVLGLHFTNDVTSWVFGNIYTPATYVNSTQIDCTIPSYDKYSAVRFKLIYFGYYEVNNTALYINYKSLDIISDFLPKQGHIDGGLSVVITGSFSILSGQTFQVFFGSKEATSVILDSDYQITAVAPPVLAEQSVEIIITVNGLSYGTGSLTFSYRSYFSIVSVTPTIGPSRGGTIVQVSLTGNVYDPIYCTFGTKLSVPIFISSNRVDCKTPPNSVGNVEVNLVQPDIYQTSSGIYFTYRKDISVNSIEPLAVPLEGGTEITVTGLNFLPGIKFKITEFGEVMDISQYISTTQIKFISPPSDSIGEKVVYLSNNGQDYYQRYDYPLIYYNGIQAISISPSNVLIGSETKVTIKGTDFQNDSRFLNSLRIESEVIATTVVDSETITATLPAFASLTAETTFDIFLTINLQDYYTGLSITYIRPPSIVDIDPKFSNSHEQYFSVKVTGQDFLHSSGLLWKLDDYSSYTIMYMNSTTILWFFSTLPAGKYKLSISNNFGFDYSYFDSLFEVSSSIQVFSVHPTVSFSINLYF
jgi:hypothetical protein